jgi:hypothetical protein
VLIQRKNGEFATVNAWVAWSGFDRKAYPITLFEWPDLRDGRVDVTPDTLVAGGGGGGSFVPPTPCGWRPRSGCDRLRNLQEVSPDQPGSGPAEPPSSRR